MKLSKLIYLLAIALLFASCKKDDDDIGPQDNTEETDFQLNGRSGLLIRNEGHFGSGDASLSFYDENEDKLFTSVYADINGVVLGDILNSSFQDDNNYYWVVNNSGKIAVTDHQLNQVGEITGLGSPRQLLPVSDTKAYVTDLFSGSIAVVDLTTLTVTGNITVAGWSEELFLIDSKVYAINKDNRQIVVIDPTTDAVLESIDIVEEFTGATHLDDHVYIGTKNEAGDTHYVLDYDVMAESFVDTLDLGAGFAWSTYLNAFDNGTKTLVYHLGGVQKINLEDTDPSPEFLVATDTYSVYGLQVIDDNSKLIVCDAKDYVVDGDVHLYDMAGNLEKTLTTGPLPNGVMEH